MHLDRLFLQRVDPTSAIHSAVISGPPPERPENPHDPHDPLSGEALRDTPAGCFPLAAAFTTPTQKQDRRPGESCAAPSLVLVEGFGCCLEDYRRIAASA
ncbi:hypothetical protein GUJ93_ZPchr0001g30403 [Zizania palustris]|uniref:Uncharacterized protein n=1 Tax=Zizania palustris TaxID=103762 RepID=A0A8J5VLD4_ZIZPA|nr:hypothetical protein GUJ93_ZPchr0001g30403 [Zizania palustris]